MDWIKLEHQDQLNKILEDSKSSPIVIFKHSIRCSISSMALNRIERAWSANTTSAYYLDLINYRDISNKVSELFNVEHQSPQVLVIDNGSCVYHDSHMAISFSSLEDHLKPSSVN